LTYVIAKSLRLLKTRWFSLPNLLTPKPLVPELIQGEATPENLRDEVVRLLEDRVGRQEIVRAFAELRRELTKDADRIAARAVIELAEKAKSLATESGGSNGAER
jgi:lipid-A-disaccharide synthase